MVFPTNYVLKEFDLKSQYRFPIDICVGLSLILFILYLREEAKVEMLNEIVENYFKETIFQNINFENNKKFKDCIKEKLNHGNMLQKIWFSLKLSF